MVSRMVVPFSLLIFSSNPISRVEFSSSRLDAGSSARMIFGLFANALVTAMRCLSPPLRVSGNLLARFARSKYLRSLCALSFLLCLLIPARGSSMLLTQLMKE